MGYSIRQKQTKPSFAIYYSAFILINFIIIGTSCNNESESQTHIKVEKISVPYTGDLLDIYFLDNEKGFIIGEFDFTNSKSVLLRTLNGGDTWLVDSFNIKNGKVESISGFGSEIFIKVTNRLNDATDIYHSINGGFDWSYYSDINSTPQFFDNLNGIMVDGTKIYKTSDSGNQWDLAYDINAMASIYLNIAGTEVSYAAGGAHHDNTDFGVLFLTKDKGVTWTNLNWGNSHITNAHFLNGETGYFFTFSRKLFKTVNGGSSFELVNDNILDSIPGCYFVSETEGYYTTTNAVYSTTDAGVSWTRNFLDNSISINNKIVFKKNGFTIGKRGLILKLEKR